MKPLSVAEALAALGVARRKARLAWQEAGAAKPGAIVAASDAEDVVDAALDALIAAAKRGAFEEAAAALEARNDAATVVRALAAKVSP